MISVSGRSTKWDVIELKIKVDKPHGNYIMIPPGEQTYHRWKPCVLPSSTNSIGSMMIPLRYLLNTFIGNWEWVLEVTCSGDRGRTFIMMNTILLSTHICTTRAYTNGSLKTYNMNYIIQDGRNLTSSLMRLQPAGIEWIIFLSFQMCRTTMPRLWDRWYFNI